MQKSANLLKMYFMVRFQNYVIASSIQKCFDFVFNMSQRRVFFSFKRKISFSFYQKVGLEHP